MLLTAKGQVRRLFIDRGHLLIKEAERKKVDHGEKRKVPGSRRASLPISSQAGITGGGRSCPRSLPLSTVIMDSFTASASVSALTWKSPPPLRLYYLAAITACKSNPPVYSLADTPSPAFLSCTLCFVTQHTS